MINLKENIIKAVNRVRDKDGNLVPMFTATSSDMVYYDINNEITIKDIIDGGRVNDSVYTYNNIFEYTDPDGGVGILTVGLPAIKDNTVEIDMYVNGAAYDNSYEETKLNIPRMTTLDTISGIANIKEMSPNGAFIFMTIKRKTTMTYTAKLYVTEPAGAKEVPFTFKTIVTPIRARFTKDSSNIIILGEGADGAKVVEIHNLSASLGSVASSAFSADQRSMDGSPMTITFFDTILHNGINYIITNTSEAAAFSCFRVSASELKIASVLSTPNVYQIRNEIRTSNDSSRVAILSFDRSLIHCMSGNIATGQYRFMSTGDDMNLYAWGCAKNASRLGVWTHFDFNHEGTRLYGTYEIGYDPTLRVCDVTSTYGHYDPNKSAPQEITINPSSNPFHIGTKVYRAIPNSQVYGSSATNTIAYIGAGTQSASLNRIVSGITRCEASAQAQLATVTHKTSETSVSETVYVVDEQYLSHSFADLGLSLPIGYSDILIHPSSGYAYAIPDNIMDTAIVPFYLSTGTPTSALSTNPTHIPIYARNKFTDISYDGTAIAYIDSPTSQPRIAMYESGRYIHRNIPAYQYTPNTAIGCRVIGNGSAVMYVYPNGMKAYKYSNYVFTETPISGISSQTFTSTDPVVALSPVTRINDSHYWTLCKFDKMSSNIVPTIYSFVYTEANGFVAANVSIEDGQYTHTTLRGYAFDYEDKHMVIVYTDSDNITRAHFYTKSGNTYKFSHATQLTIGFRSYGVGTNAYCCSLISENTNESMFVYLGTNFKITAIRVNWASNTSTSVDSSYIDGTSYTSLSGMKYCIPENKLYIATSTRIHVLEYFQGTLKPLHIHDALESTKLFDRFTISDVGAVSVIERNGTYMSLVARLKHTRLTGDVHMTGKYTDNGWTNVEITATDAGLKDSVAFAVMGDREVIAIGSSRLAWNPAHVKIKRITIMGETAGKYSYRIGYSASLIASLGALTHITKSTNIVDESSNVKRITIRGISIPPTDWRYDAGSGFYYCRIYDVNIDPTALVNVNINNLESWAFANAAGVISLSTEHEGYVEMYSGNIPVGNINVDIDIFKSL